jgi:two-component system, NtrC family, response regulator HydG
MAPSESDPTSVIHDPILVARLEAIGQLAGTLTERVVVIDRRFNVLYTNHGGRFEEMAGQLEKSKCYQAFAHRTEPCGTCTAAEVLDASDDDSLCPEIAETTPCGMKKAFPLLGQDGRVASMLVLLEPPSLSRLPGASIPDEAVRPMVREHLGDLIGRSSPMQQLFEMVNLVADSSATVLIQGESGTGKELVANTIHQLSSRCEKPFVVVDCGSLPETLLESELFGHVKGAFTGAVTNKPGLFEAANGGTIFLDEIADTTPTFQAKLLRVLQEGEIKRVGGNHRIKINVRVISATNKDLAELVHMNRFRQDLYYRLAVLPLTVPPLRERPEDIALLVEHFVKQSCARQRQPRRAVSPDVLYALTQAAWPGNVRELQHCIERAVVTTKGPALTCTDILGAGSEKPLLDLRSVSKCAVKQAERARIIQALHESGGNRAQAAKHLKISRAGLYNKLREYDLSGWRHPERQDSIGR